MPVYMRGGFTVAADRQTVWTRLHDPRFLRGCMRECEALRRVDDARLFGSVRVRLGLLSVLFHGQIDYRDVDPPRGWRMVVSGVGGVAGRAGGSARVTLDDVQDGTVITYTLDADLGTRLGRLGDRLIDAAAQRVAERFSTRVSAALPGVA